MIMEQNCFHVQKFQIILEFDIYYLNLKFTPLNFNSFKFLNVIPQDFFRKKKYLQNHQKMSFIPWI